MMVTSSSETCSSRYDRYSRIPQDVAVQKASLTRTLTVDANRLNKDALSEPQKSGNHARFAPSSQVVCTLPHRLDCSQEEINHRWFRKAEYAELIWESSVTLTLLKCDKKKGLVDDTLLCERGLLDTAILIERQQERSCINKLILLEMKVTEDAEAVSQLYHECALTVCQRARDKAIIDEEYAKHYATEVGSEDNYGRNQHTQADNRTAIEQMILRELEKSTSHDETEQKLVKALKRLNKRKEKEAEDAKQIEEMVLMEQLKQLADLYADPSLTPEERAAVEQAATDLLQGGNDATNSNAQNVQTTSSPPLEKIESQAIQDDEMSENPRKRQKIT
ncbi:unnamed protein product [Cylindrotheca closterium]|uniref:Uncharacterized protein n=1 Tax=Cylindrotheca closterium TaxID=2856 RepID=A0AAD2GEJ0_9STRA|nr:unnamed protein product [Cylindrotheca closterium]